MTRSEILSHALFDTGGEIDGIKFGPLSQPVLVILKRRRNALVAESKKDQEEHEAIAEIFFVLSRTKEQRALMFRDSDEEWELKVGEFTAGLDDKTLQKFRDEYLGPALMAIAYSAVESVTPGKPLPTRQTSPSLSKVQDGLASTTSQKALEEKTCLQSLQHE